MIIYSRFDATKIVYENAALVTLSRADLHGADMHEADLHEADLHEATMPDGRTFEAYAADPLAGICQDAAARSRAVAAWGKHSWRDCPMHVANGYTGIGDAPAAARLAVAAFVALFDGVLLPVPRPASP